jgi:type VI secretion system protein ImpA
MASPEILDFGSLLAPIAGENPAGESVRYSGEYDAIQEARRSEDELPMGDWQREIKTADWKAAVRIATDALTNKSKDLQVAVWLVEALVKRNGFAGLRDGLRLLRELQENFWENLYPEIEDGDLEFRAGPLAWLNEKLPTNINEVALTQQGEEPYSWNHMEESRAVDNLGRQSPEAMAAAIAEGKITGEQFQKAVEATPRSFYEVLFEDLNQTKQELTKLEKVVDEKFGRDAPSLLAVRKTIEDYQSVVSGIVKRKREQDPNYKPESESGLSETDPFSGSNMEGVNMAGARASGWSSEPTSREDAFRRLVLIAAYLKRVEPQHPVSYLLERAVRWTKMPLEEWLGEVIRNDEVLGHLRDTLGIKDREIT